MSVVAHTWGKEQLFCFEGGAGTEYLPQAFSISTITACGSGTALMKGCCL
jgi:hypothetical protein